MFKKALSSLLLSILLGMVGLVSAQTDAQTQTVTVTARYLNVRHGPSTATSVLTIIHAGETYPVIGQSGTWWQIQVGNVIGFVSGRYVRVNGGGPTTPTANPNPATPTPCALTTMFWGASTGGVCVDPAHTTRAAFQTYQYGFMVWLADSGDIWVFIDAPRYPHGWLHLPQSNYANLPDATGPTPAGLVQPINGFGRVWANMLDGTSSNLRDRIGWATANEVAYTATWQFYGAAGEIDTFISLPPNNYGQIVDASMNMAQIVWRAQ